MKIISYNIRSFGVGIDSKFGEAKRIIRKEKPSFLALQETKLHLVDNLWVKSLWGNSDYEFIQQEMVGKSGGQLLIWDKQEFEAPDVIKEDHVVGVRGKWIGNDSIIIVLNVYRPHDDIKKQKLWDCLGKLIDNNEAWVLCGDFNEVRGPSERFNCEFVENIARWFNDFIRDNSLVDIPMGGRIFTRFSDDGTKFSKLDRFLVSESFHQLWNNLSSVALDRTKSDHCPIMLCNDVKDFGTKPIKVFDIWLEDDEAVQIIKDSKTKFGNLDDEIEAHKNAASALELKAEMVKLNDNELEDWKKERKQ
ncbi:uncharacterized protein [Rutidosis leptorrhynchoides]|uniref:uncharacterized protein n=1 Tax=Rutidosis leptorrhynchoides TaxID=125765 RepID=UPI003A99BBED